jgi:hypothetical protein
MRATNQWRAVRVAAGLAAVFTVTTGAGTGLASPPPGSRNIQDFAIAGFETRLSDCLSVITSVQYFAGDNLQDPLGGKPRSWADAPVRVTVFDSCDNDTEIWRAEGLGFPDNGPEFDRLDSASLDVSLVTLTDGLGSSLDAEVHLDWVGNDDTAVRIDHLIDAKDFRQERFETARVTGAIELGASPFWSSLTVTDERTHDVVIGTANSITVR